MSEKNRTVMKVFSFVLLAIGLVLLAYSITGNVSRGTLTDYCSTDNDCAIGKVCCSLQGDSGMCYEKSVCSNLKTNLVSQLKETPMKPDYSLYMNLGIVLIIIAVIILYVIFSKERKEKKKPVKKSKNKVIKKQVKKQKTRKK